MPATRTVTVASASSQQVTANWIKGLLEQQVHVNFVLSTSDDSASLGSVGTVVEKTETGRTIGLNVVKSLMPKGVDLNGRVTKYDVSGAREEPVDARQLKNETRLRQDIPTADYIRRGSFKVDTKLLIKIVPTSKKSRLNNYIPNLTFNTFSLQSVAEPDAERYQLHETFEDEVLFLFGRRPRLWTLQGIVTNGRRAAPAPEVETPEAQELRLARDMDYANRLLRDWEDFYRGSRAVEHRARTFLTYDDTVNEATLLELTVVRNAQIPAACNATLTFVLHQRSFVGQEYREGITAPNLADLIAKTNSSAPLEDLVEPSDLGPARYESAEITRQEAQAAEELAAKSEKVRTTETEKQNLLKSIDEKNKAIDQADFRINQIKQEQAAAQEIIDEATESTPETAEAQKVLDDAAKELPEVQAFKKKSEADLAQLEARAAEIDFEVTKAQSEENDAKAQHDATAATSEAMP